MNGKKLGTDARGNYKKFIDGQTFYLGHKDKVDEAEAQVRAIRLGQLREAINGQGWTEETKDIGLAIARGQQEIAVPLSPLGTFKTMERIAVLQDRFPFLRFVPASAADVVQEEQKTEAARLRREANVIEHGQAGGIGFHAALDQFCERSVNLDKEPGTDKVTASAMRVCRNVGILKQHHKDFPMADLTLAKLDTILAYWASRPVVKRSGKAASVHTCREQIKIFRRFLRWACRAELWQQPNGYSVTPIRIRRLDEEDEAKATEEQVQRYKRAELETLWQYARPLERLFLLLGLNCGFGSREISTLRLKEIHGDRIKRIRRKSGVYGQWLLWPETVAAIEWYRNQRTESDAPELMLTSNGVPYARRTAGGHRNMAVANAWVRLLDRVAADTENPHPEYGLGGARRLSFGKLRKTAANLIRRASSGEVAKTFLCHGKPVKDDPLSEIYSNRDFNRVFKALRRVHRHLASIFATVADPFPAKNTNKGLSLGMRNKIKRLRAQGFKMKKIAEDLGISRDTARKYARA